MALIEAMGQLHPDDVFFVVDGERKVLFWSDGAERLLGYAADEAVGEHCLKTNRCVECIQGCGLSRYGAVQDVPITLYTAEGAPVDLLKTARGFFAEDGNDA